MLSPPLCAICNHRAPIYTCPRCRTRTCSLSCSSNHKSREACSGQRDRVKHVKMNEYGWGTMMDDYVFLEEVGRNVGEWGREIARGGLMSGRGEQGHGKAKRGRLPRGSSHG